MCQRFISVSFNLQEQKHKKQPRNKTVNLTWVFSRYCNDRHISPQELHRGPKIPTRNRGRRKLRSDLLFLWLFNLAKANESGGRGVNRIDRQLIVVSIRQVTCPSNFSPPESAKSRSTTTTECGEDENSST